MHPRQRVLIVDQADETRAVLRTVLEHRGYEILEARRSEDGLKLVRSHHPDLIVLDMEAGDRATADMPARFRQQAQPGETPLVILGSARRLKTEVPGSEVVTKPYHYGPLIRRIEELLAKAA